MIALTALLLALPAFQAEPPVRPSRRDHADRPAQERVEQEAPRREFRGREDHRLISPRLMRILADHPRLRAELLQVLRERPQREDRDAERRPARAHERRFERRFERGDDRPTERRAPRTESRANPKNRR